MISLFKVFQPVVVEEYTSDLKRLNADLEGVSSAQTTLGNAVGKPRNRQESGVCSSGN